jgi:hypothetical protein
MFRFAVSRMLQASVSIQIAYSMVEREGGLAVVKRKAFSPKDELTTQVKYAGH